MRKLLLVLSFLLSITAVQAQSPAMSAVTIGRNTTVLDTDPDGKQVFLVIGDSKAAGSNNTTGPGPTPTAGTVFQWDKVNNQVIQVTNTDVLCADCDPGQGYLLQQQRRNK
jgi:hypothetical protein